MPDTHKRIRQIQVLRGIAAMMVVVHHFAVITQPFSAADSLLRYRHLVDLGASGVDIFFCISGVVMMVTISASQATGRFRVADFLARRAIRILPLYWIVSTVFITLVLLGSLTYGPSANVWSLPLIPGYLVASYILLPTYVPGTRTIAPFLFPGWTLSYEFYFYGLIACAAWLLVRPARIAVALLATIGGLCALARVLPISGLAIQQFTASTIVFEFVFGVGAFLVARAFPIAGLRGFCLIVGTLGLMATIFYPAMYTHRVLRWGIPGALVTLGAMGAAPAQQISPLALRLGDASFSIYLIHLIPLYLYAVLLSNGHFSGGLSQFIAIVAGSIATALAGLGVHRWIEKPVLAWLNRAYSAPTG
jgi:exopolysaccharide production protein ExoZ